MSQSSFGEIALYPLQKLVKKAPHFSEMSETFMRGDSSREIRIIENVKEALYM
jgi:hypothetical protein